MRLRERIAALATLGCVSVSGPACSGDSDEIDRVIARQPRGSGVPDNAVGGGTDDSTGAPVGYPTRLPVVPGGRAVSGGVDPGVVRTATLVYENMTSAEYRDALAAMMQPLGQRITSDNETPSGSRRLRLAIGTANASALVLPEGGGIRVTFTMMDRETPP